MSTCFEALSDGGNLQKKLITGLLALSEQFTRQGGLVDKDVASLNETAVGGDDITNLEGDEIIGNKIGRIDFFPAAATLDLCLGGKRSTDF